MNCPCVNDNGPDLGCKRCGGMGEIESGIARLNRVLNDTAWQKELTPKEKLEFNRVRKAEERVKDCNPALDGLTMRR
jgi:hypothetical protein